MDIRYNYVWCKGGVAEGHSVQCLTCSQLFLATRMVACSETNSLMDTTGSQISEGPAMCAMSPGVALLIWFQARKRFHALNEENSALLKSSPVGSKTKSPPKSPNKNLQKSTSINPVGTWAKVPGKKKTQHQGAAKKSVLDARNPTRFAGRYLLNFVAPIRFGKCWDWRRRKLHHSYLRASFPRSWKVQLIVLAERENTRFLLKKNLENFHFWEQHHFF